MTQLVVRSKRLRDGAKTPTKSHDTDAGWDLYAEKDVTIIGASNVVGIGVALAIPDGYFGLVRDRSGNAKRGLRVSGGVMDSGYRGEYFITLDALHTVPTSDHCTPRIEIKAGDRIAQLLLLPVPDARMEDVETLEETPRNKKGFNSTGR